MSTSADHNALPSGTTAITIANSEETVRKVGGPSPVSLETGLSPSSSQPISPAAQGEDDFAASIGYYDADFSWFGRGDTYAKRAAKLLYPAAMATLNTMEWIGEKVVTGLGLDQSRFQYAVDEFDRQERKRLQKEQRALDAQIEAYRRRGLEDGMDDPDNDISDVPYAPPINMRS